MKKILIASISLLAMISCRETNDTKHIYDDEQIQVVQEQPEPLIPTTYVCDFPYSKNIDQINVVTIGECEYLVTNAQSQSDVAITHKGDCKFCIQRQEDMIRRILLEKNP